MGEWECPIIVYLADHYVIGSARVFHAMNEIQTQKERGRNAFEANISLLVGFRELGPGHSSTMANILYYLKIHPLFLHLSMDTFLWHIRILYIKVRRLQRKRCVKLTQ